MQQRSLAELGVRESVLILGLGKFDLAVTLRSLVNLGHQAGAVGFDCVADLLLRNVGLFCHLSYGRLKVLGADVVTAVERGRLTSLCVYLTLRFGSLAATADLSSLLGFLVVVVRVGCADAVVG